MLNDAHPIVGSAAWICQQKPKRRPAAPLFPRFGGHLPGGFAARVPPDERIRGYRPVCGSTTITATMPAVPDIANMVFIWTYGLVG